MPFILTPAEIAAESLVFDGLDLAQGPNGAIQLDAFTPPFAKKRYEWVEAADSDGALLARDPLVGNGQAVIKLAIVAGDRDGAQEIIGMITDKLEEADRNPLGIPLVWTPSNSATQLTFYVLTGEVTDLPIDWESGYMVYQPSVTITLECRPYGHGDPITVTGTATAGPLVTLDLTNVPGDVPALGTLRITDSSSQSRRTVEWGAEYRHYNPASPWSLVLDSDDLTVAGFAGAQTTRTGAYDPGGAGNSIITTTVAAAWQAACGTGAQVHVGTFLVKARLYTAGVTDAQVRFAWRAGDGDYRRNDPVAVTWADRFGEIDLGLITVPEALAGTQTWDGRVEMYSAVSDALELDDLMLIPVEAGCGKAVASYSYSPGVIVGRDDFTGTTGGAALNARVAPAGGTWTSSGVATDFVFIDAISGLAREAVSRTTTVEASPRFGILGSTNYTNVEVQASIYMNGGTTHQRGVIARWTDSSNYLRGLVEQTIVSGGEVSTLKLTQRVAAADTILATAAIPAASMAVDQFYKISLISFASGRTILRLLNATGTSVLASVEASTSVLATGGTLATGKPGIYDFNAGTAAIRVYDDIAVSTPAAEPIVLFSGRSIEIRHDSTERESSAGGSWGRPQSYRGSRFYVQPAGDQDRTTRVAVKASRNDLASAADDNLSDQITLEATIVPRYSVVPRS